MSTLINLSLCLTDLIDLANKGHSAFSRSQKNGKVYVNLTQWINDEPDQYNNNASVQLNPHKDKRDADIAAFGKCYVGNGKYAQRPEPQAAGNAGASLDMSRFGGAPPAPGANTSAAATGYDDLPF